MTNTDNHFRSPRCRDLILNGAALLVAIVIGNMASIAQARCGDYVVIGNPAHQAAVQTQQHAEPRLNKAAPREQPFPLPCHGPGCQQGEAFPPLPVPTVITISPELVAIVPTACTAVSASGESRVDDRASRRTEGVLDRVERPPRFSA